MAISVSGAIDSLREDLRQALAKAQPDIVFTPGDIEVELGVTFAEETSVEGGIKAYIFSASAGSSDSQTHVHKLKFTLAVTDANGRPLKLSAPAPAGG